VLAAVEAIVVASKAEALHLGGNRQGITAATCLEIVSSELKTIVSSSPPRGGRNTRAAKPRPSSMLPESETSGGTEGGDGVGGGR
jgi:hypothetical protein